MSITSAEAYEAMRAHHRLLGEQLTARTTAVAEAVAAGRPHETAVGDVIAYLADEVLPHAAAEEETIYPVAAATRGDLADTVNEMVVEHRRLTAAAEALADSPEGGTAAQQAEQIARLFTAHMAKENDLVVPALLTNPDVDLGALLTRMHQRTAEVARTGGGGAAAARDPERTLLGLLVAAARGLADAGQADLACRLAAAAWAALRSRRPDLAVTVTAELHGLTRHAGTGPVPAQPSAPVNRCAPDGAGTADDTKLDVRDLAPPHRHETIFARYRGLAPGQSFVLINDHDPKPLRYQFEAEHAGQFTWDYLEAGPTTWRVRIGRPAA